MDRRIFVKNTSLALAGLSLGNELLALSPKEIKLVLLHTNDVHSRIEPIPEDGSRNAGLGGVARRKTLIDSIRKENENVLLLDAGDAFQGTPYFNFFGGELEFKLMSKLGYDAVTLGNHDFDNGIEGIEKNLPNTNFPLLIANYDFKNNSLNERFKPYKIFQKQGIKIGVFGIGIELDGLVLEKLHQKTIYQDPVEKSKEIVNELKRKKCDLIVCLSHLGYKYNDNKVSDIALANKVSGIDLIIGGHTHTFLDKPVTVTNNEGFSTLINQVGFAGINLGKVEFTFLKGKTKAVQSSSSSIIIDKQLDNLG